MLTDEIMSAATRIAHLSRLTPVTIAATVPATALRVMLRTRTVMASMRRACTYHHTNNCRIRREMPTLASQ